jgi:hypothetical protein
MRRAVPTLLASLLLALALTGCGDDGGGGGTDAGGDGETTDLGPIELIRSAPAALEEAGTAHMAMTFDAGPASVEATGEFDFDAQTGAMTMELPAPASGELEMVFDGTTYYMTADAFGTAIPGLDADWIRIDLEALAGQTGVDLSQLPQGSNNPADALDALAAVSEDGIEEVGTEEVRGVEATHFAAEIDMAAAIEQADEQSGGELLDDAMAEQFLQQYGDQPVPVEIWIDADGLVRRQTMSFEVAGEEASMQIEMFDYGEPVDVQVPDAADTVDFAELLGSIGQGGN